jgi:prepilin-type N-terminal cleavage/methylation domain-containing protein
MVSGIFSNFSGLANNIFHLFLLVQPENLIFNNAIKMFSNANKIGIILYRYQGFYKSDKGRVPRMEKSNSAVKRYQAGFTLVELLVVISIIALLMAILMPAFGKAKKQARAVMCKARLKQWGTIWTLYCDDNDGYFSGGEGVYWARGEWIICLRSQYHTKTDILKCPMAVKRRPDGAEWGGTFYTYDMPAETAGSITAGGEEASYGANDWIYNPNAKNNTRLYHVIL